MRFALLLLLVGTIAASSIAEANRSREASIPLDDVAAVWVKQHDGTWQHWITGAPDFVNREFAERYVREVAPQPTVATGPVEIGWWLVEHVGDVTTATLLEDRTSSGRRHAMILRLTCTGQALSLAVGFDQNSRGVPRMMDPELFDGLSGRRRGGQIKLTFEVKVDGHRKEPYIHDWWDLTRDYRWAHAPEPSEVVDYMRGGDSLVVHTNELTGFAGYAEPSLRGVDDVLEALPCVAP